MSISSIEPTSGLMFIPLKPFEERTEKGMSSFDVIDNSRKSLGALDEGISMLVSPPSIPGLGSTGGFQFLYSGYGR